LPLSEGGAAGIAPAADGDDEFWVDSTAPLPTMPRPRRLRPVSDDVARGRGDSGGGVAPGQSRTVREMRSVRAPAFADQLQSNVEMRSRLCAPGAQHWPYRNTGRILFTEVTRPHKKVAFAARSWVADKATGIREPTESEARTAAVRTQPPILQPRIKRNM